MITREVFRALALDLEGVTEQPHFERLAFRVRRIFATLAPDGLSANLSLAPEDQAFRCEVEPDVFRPLPNRWGARGWTIVDLGRAEPDVLRSALQAAWQQGSRR